MGVVERERLRIEKAEFQKEMEAVMQKQLAFERSKMTEDATKAKEAMEADLAKQKANIAADAKAERLAAEQESQHAKEFVHSQVAELDTTIPAEQQARKSKTKKTTKS